MSRSIDFTHGNIRCSLVQFAFPFFLISLIQSMYNIADIMVVGRFCGNAGIAATSIAGSLTNSLTYAIIALCNGGAIMVAQYAGRKSSEDILDTSSTLFSLSFVLAIAVSVLFYVLTPAIFHALNTPDAVFDSVQQYFRICLTGFVFIFGYNALASIMRGLGDSRTPMYFAVASCLLNILLDLLLVGYMGMGIAGAAIATVISQAASFFGFIVCLQVTGVTGFRLFPFRLNRHKALMILKLGIPGAVQNVVVSGGFLMVSSITNTLGISAASGVAVASKINNICQMPADAIGTAASSMVGQNVGSRNYDRARQTMRSAIVISLIIGIAAFIPVQIIPLRLLSLLTTDPDVLAQALPYLRVTSLDYLLVAMVFPLNALCNGSGHTMFTMIPSIVSSVIARVPVAAFCFSVLGLGITGVGISTPTGTTSAILICTAYYLSNHWCSDTID
ncbi:MAG: MATE family efflux transporter [Clostridia bacterium]|nr:MATE family efflux transporter [Clostridia bacterium]